MGGFNVRFILAVLQEDLKEVNWNEFHWINLDRIAAVCLVGLKIDEQKLSMCASSDMRRHSVFVCCLLHGQKLAVNRAGLIVSILSDFRLTFAQMFVPVFHERRPVAQVLSISIYCFVFDI